jgi:DNA-binding NarL/FixJ family response regulator
MIQSPSYVTRILVAGPSQLRAEVRHALARRREFDLLQDDVEHGDQLLNAIDEEHPDVLALDMALPGLITSTVLTTLSARKLRPYVVATAAHPAPALADLQHYPAVAAALPKALLVSPLLPHVLAGVAEGCRYFIPDPDHARSGLTKEETLLLALMAVGLETHELMRDLRCTQNVVYINQCNLRKKLGVRTNARAILIGIRLGLVGALIQPERGVADRHTV